MVEKQKIVLDEYEKEIIELYENGRLKPYKLQTDYQIIAKSISEFQKTIFPPYNVEQHEKVFLAKH